MTAYQTLETLAAQHTARFMEDAAPATSRQIGFLNAIITSNKIDIAEIVDAVEFYNGGNAWGIDKECASMLIATYASKEDMRKRTERTGR